MTSNRSRIAAGSGLLALGGLTGAAMNAGGEQRAAEVATRPPAIVRTDVVRQTVHRTRHEKPRPAPAAVTPAAQGVPVATTPPASSAPPAAAASQAPAAAAPVVHTRQSGGGGEREGGDDQGHASKPRGTRQDD